MPFPRKVSNSLSTFVASVFAGRRIVDSQSGFRLFSKRFLEKSDLKSFGYGVETEILLTTAQNKFKVETIPVTVIYRRKKNVNFPKDLKIIISILKTIF